MSDTASQPKGIRAKAFWFHFNKPASLAAGRVQVSLHYDGRCHLVDNVVCLVPTEGRVRKDQPRWVMVGAAKEIVIENGVAKIS